MNINQKLGEPEKQLLEAVKSSDVEKVNQLITPGKVFHLEAVDEYGWTPLNWAAGRGNLEILRLLVKHGANISNVGEDGRSAYEIALAASHPQVAAYLKSLRVKDNHMDSESKNAHYCKAYYLRDLRGFVDWSDSKKNHRDTGHPRKEELDDETVVFLHEDYTVTRSIWDKEHIVFDEITPAWIEFCQGQLKFQPPTDIDLMAKEEQTTP